MVYYVILSIIDGLLRSCNWKVDFLINFVNILELNDYSGVWVIIGIDCGY